MCDLELVSSGELVQELARRYTTCVIFVERPNEKLPGVNNHLRRWQGDHHQIITALNELLYERLREQRVTWEKIQAGEIDKDDIDDSPGESR
ncbi:MAG: hypothetical protein ACYTG0_25050 [Planctomycetota bacterium]|jgi:hypothetical protein